MNHTVKSTTRGGSHVDNRSLIYNHNPMKIIKHEKEDIQQAIQISKKSYCN